MGVYSLNVSVSDGKFTTFQSARVTVTMVTENILENAVILRFGKITPEEFVDSYKNSFVKIMKNLFNVRSKDVEILGVQLTFGSGSAGGKVRYPRAESWESGVRRGETETQSAAAGRQPGVEVLFAVKQDNSIYFSRDEIRTSLEQNFGKLNFILQINKLFQTGRN